MRKIGFRQFVYFAGAIAALAFAGCERLFDNGAKENVAAAGKKAQAGDFRGAIKLYESALGSAETNADVHYRLAVIYDDKLKRPIDAMHHFQRYLELAPDGAFAKEAKAYKKEGDLKLLNSLNQGTPINQEEAVRLKNENLALRKQLVELRAQKAVDRAVARAEVARPVVPAGARRHVVQSGETLASISHKYYKTRTKAQDILDANHQALGGKTMIRPGQTLVIP